MSNAQKTATFLAGTDAATRVRILNNIANHYGITPDEAFAEVTDADAESLLDYVTGPERSAIDALMRRQGLR